MVDKINKIENIVFDLGGVLLDLDHQRTYDKMNEVLNVDFYPHNHDGSIVQMLEDFEKGKVNTETFIWNLQRQANGKVPSGNQVVEAWNAMLIGWKPDKFDLLNTLREKYKLFLLSNTNAIHYQWIRSSLQNRHGIEDFEKQFFDMVFYSHLIEMRKPDENIYNFVIEQAGLTPENTLFIDDTQENIESASRAGWQTFHYDPNDDLSYVVSAVLNLI